MAAAEPAGALTASGRLADQLTVVRGGGDLATGVVYRLRAAGMPVIVLELARPLAVRRRVALATAALEGEIDVEGLIGRRVGSAQEALRLATGGVVPVLVAPEWPDWDAAAGGRSPVRVLVDARLAKRNIDTRIEQAPLVIGLGPGFTAGRDCHAVVETLRGHRLGRVIWQGSAAADTGTPGRVAGKIAERVLRSPVAGQVDWDVEIGDRVAASQELGTVGGARLCAPFAGVVRGLIAPGIQVEAGLKIGDLDPRADPSAAFTISDKALAVGGGVLEGVLTWLSRPQPGRP
ncbi:MAG: selenium-dependent molybdenum cofactor biosynthesis protein YqeB [Candidatus Promineifilaceae bacterium]